MADADFGYVGGAPGKIDLYVGKEVVCRAVPMESVSQDAQLAVRYPSRAWLGALGALRWEMGKNDTGVCIVSFVLTFARNVLGASHIPSPLPLHICTPRTSPCLPRPVTNWLS